MKDNIKRPKAQVKLGRSQKHLKPERPELELELFVSGITPKSVRAIEVLKDICESHFAGRYSLKIIDIYREPDTAKKNHIFAVPALIRRQPGKRKMFIGDFSDAAPVLREFGILKGSKYVAE